MSPALFALLKEEQKERFSFKLEKDGKFSRRENTELYTVRLVEDSFISSTMHVPSKDLKEAIDRLSEIRESLELVNAKIEIVVE